jgi:adenylate cyclase
MNNLARRKLRTVAAFTLWGAAIGAALGPVVGQFDDRQLLFAALRGLVVGALIGPGLGVGEELIFPRWSRTMSFARLSVVRVGSYAVLMIMALTAVNAVDVSIVRGLGLLDSVAYYATEGGLLRDLVFAVVASFLLTGFLQVRRLHNPGEIRRLLTGRYHYPVEETRIFLFADVVGSTGIAERLGHMAYSSFLRDCFSDISEAILAWKGEVYQHAGDSVLVTWRMHKGIRSAACVQCFFDMIQLLERRHDDYRRQYGTIPRLRAGIHGGDVVTTWVGEARKDLAFHGDTMNTAARVETACKELDAQCLVSELVYAAIELPPHLEARPMGEVELRGRTEALLLYAVDRV